MNRRRYLILLLYLAIALPWIVSGAVRALKTTANSPLDWVSTEFPAKRAYEKFRGVFGTGDVVIVSWPGCTINDPSIDQLTLSLRHSAAFQDSQQRPWLERVTSGREEFLRLTTAPFRLSGSQAKNRLRGFLIGKDGEQTCIVVALNAQGLAQRAVIVPRLEYAVRKFCGVRSEDIHLAGPVIDGLTVDLATQAALHRYAPVSCVAVFLLCWLCLNSVYAAALVFGASLLCQGLTLALIGWCHDSMSALLIVMPPLIQVLTVAGGIHLMNYYFDAHDRKSAADHAFHVGWLPCSLSAVTTAIGLGSLAVSQLLPVRSFGGYAAMGVLATLLVLLTIIPGSLMLWAARRRQSSTAWFDMNWRRYTRLIERHHAFILGVAVAATMIAAVGVPWLHTSVRIETLFDEDSKILADYQWLEDRLGALVPIEVVLTFDEHCKLDFTQRMILVQNVQKALKTTPSVAGVVSSISFLPEFGPLPDDPRLAVAVRQERLRQLRNVLSESDYLRIQGTEEHYRITGLVSALEDIDYGDFLSGLRHRIQPVAAIDGRTPMGMSLNLTGIMPVVHEIQRQLLNDLYSSFLTAFAVITVLMTLVQAGLVAGVVAMIPNVFPTVLVFGFLGWQGMPVDIGSVMTASVALGIAVDDTLHFLTFFQQRARIGDDRAAAVLSACQHCGKAMLQTTVICGLGLLTFSMADFVPTARFAWMMLTLLLIAVIGDLVVLPALLLGPLGQLFCDSPRTEPHSEDSTLNSLAAEHLRGARGDDATAAAENPLEQFAWFYHSPTYPAARQP